MKTLQDKVCDALTLVGLLAVIGFGSASLLPEGHGPEKADEAAPADSVMLAPSDTLTEVPVQAEPVRGEEVANDTFPADSLDYGLEAPSDTLAGAAQCHESEPERASDVHNDARHEDHHATDQPAEPSKTGTDAHHQDDASQKQHHPDETVAE